MTRPVSAFANRSTLAVVLILVPMAVIHSVQEMMEVPRAAPPVIDGRIEAGEWEHATSRTLADGAVVRMQHDRQHLYIAVTAPRPFFTSMCVAHGTTVRILHASAALGSVSYSRSDGGWVTSDTEFRYGMRNRALTEVAQTERREYLLAHGWVASTFNMGGGLVQELQLSRALLPDKSRVALAFYVAEGGAVFRWPEALPADDACAEPKLVQGFVPPRLGFEPDRWPSLEFR